MSKYQVHPILVCLSLYPFFLYVNADTSCHHFSTNMASASYEIWKPSHQKYMSMHIECARALVIHMAVEEPMPSTLCVCNTCLFVWCCWYIIGVDYLRWLCYFSCCGCWRFYCVVVSFKLSFWCWYIFCVVLSVISGVIGVFLLYCMYEGNWIQHITWPRWISLPYTSIFSQHLGSVVTVFRFIESSWWGRTNCTSQTFYFPACNHIPWYPEIEIVCIDTY